eukprot:TRINITY_DN8702_c0_g1_i3.p3 TRINITY_DN8702_c0_g1~~TRINITY_DN8702_c0_g1_i3.p3  ORF type:complete len:104 (+),score=14.65 TRINITY_DN8702_c0_g1_i3:232-543(+)
MSTITMRIKFPPTYPLIYKTLRVDGTLTVSEAVAYIAETLHVAGGDSIGLYIASLDEWLEEGKPLSDFDFLEDVVRRFLDGGGLDCAFLWFACCLSIISLRHF